MESLKKKLMKFDNKFSKMKSLEKKLMKFDYIRVSFADLNGFYLSRLYPSRLAKELVAGKCAIYAGAIAFGSTNMMIKIPEVMAKKGGNVKIVLVPDTLHAWPSTNKHDQKICQILCEFRWPVEKTLLEAHPRVAARRQLDRLEQLGLRLFSAFEPEMTLVKMNTIKPDIERAHVFSGDLIAEREEFFIEIDIILREMNIKMRHFDSEYGIGQVEMPLEAEWGIKAADDIFIFKQVVKEIGRKHGINVSFMTLPGANFICSGFHYNHSLWSKTDDKCIMVDENANSMQLSQTALYWIGGVLHHTKALSAFCSPTVNCYRRLFTISTPSSIYWAENDRSSIVRAIIEGSGKKTYLENRLPSSACNPYLVLAATVAAGIDGIVNKIEPPSAGSKVLGEVPSRLGEALKCLENDSVISEALGQELISWFLMVKRESDLEHLKGVDLKNTDDSNFDLERKEYFDFT